MTVEEIIKTVKKHKIERGRIEKHCNLNHSTIWRILTGKRRGHGDTLRELEKAILKCIKENEKEKASVRTT